MREYVESYLIEPVELARRLGQPDLVVLDAHVFLPSPRFDGDYRVERGDDAWQANRIPGSRHADLVDALSDRQAAWSFMRPTPEILTDAVAALGVETDSHVVVYDRADGFWAARLWWMLRSIGIEAQVLNGGWQAWEAAHLPQQHGPDDRNAVVPSCLPLRPVKGLWADRPDVERVLHGEDARTLVCALSASVFAGQTASRYARRGHIPGSVNLPARSLVDTTGRYLPLPALREALAPLLDASPPSLLLYCGGGISATVNALALTLIAQHDPRARREISVYDGSLQEWAADPTLPLDTLR